MDADRIISAIKGVNMCFRRGIKYLMLSNLLNTICCCAGDTLRCVRKNFWVAVSYLAAFLLGVLLGLFFFGNDGSLFFGGTVTWFIDLFYIGSFFGAFFRFLLTLLVFSALFMLLSQNRYTFFIGYLCLIIRGYAFVCAAKLLVESFFLVALIFVVLAFLLQQIALIYQLSAISSYYFCNNISLKTDFCVLAVFFLLQCVVFALAECLIIFVFIMPLLSV